jgi:hypothetical protein
VEERRSDVEGLAPPDWQSVLDHPYSPWLEDHLVVDTALVTARAAIEIVDQHLDLLRGPSNRITNPS